jgi:hypothetical protein
MLRMSHILRLNPYYLKGLREHIIRHYSNLLGKDILLYEGPIDLLTCNYNFVAQHNNGAIKISKRVFDVYGPSLQHFGVLKDYYFTTKLEEMLKFGLEE